MNLTADIHINAQPEAVWAFVVQPTAWPFLVPALQTAELVTPPPLVTGSRAKFVFRQGGRHVTAEADFPEVTAPRCLRLHHRLADYGVDAHGTLSLVPENVGTRVKQEVTLDFPNPMLRMIGESMLRAQDPEAQLRLGLGRLKLAVEARPA